MTYNKISVKRIECCKKLSGEVSYFCVNMHIHTYMNHENFNVKWNFQYSFVCGTNFSGLSHEFGRVWLLNNRFDCDAQRYIVIVTIDNGESFIGYCVYNDKASHIHRLFLSAAVREQRIFVDSRAIIKRVTDTVISATPDTPLLREVIVESCWNRWKYRYIRHIGVFRLAW